MSASEARVESSEAAALALRMRRHFAHKVPVHEEGSVTRIVISLGEFELEPADGALVVRARAADAGALAEVEDVVARHLVRFAREEMPALSWTGRG